MKKSILLFSGFLLFILGMLALILSLVGVKLAPLLWIDSWGALTGMVIRLTMILIGLLLAYIANTDWNEGA